MKNWGVYCFLSFIIVGGTSFGQISFPIDENTGQISYSEVIKVDSVGKDLLYSRAKEWFVFSFKSANDVIQLDDPANGKLIGKANFNVYSTAVVTVNAGYIRFTVEIQVKDGRYKYEFSNFWHEAGNTTIYTPGDLRNDKPGGGIMTMGMKNWNGIKSQTDENVRKMIQSLKEYMASSTSKKDEW